MALASEVNGSIDTALSWARKALSKGDRRASNYIKILKRRKIDQNPFRSEFYYITL